MSDIERSEKAYSSIRKSILENELGALKNNLGKYIQYYLEECQLDSSDVEEAGIPKNVYKKIVAGQFDKLPLQNLLKYIVSLGHEIDTTINPSDKKKLKLYNLEPKTIKFKKGKTKK